MEMKIKNESAVTALLLLTNTRFDSVSPTLEKKKHVEASHWLKEMLQFINSQAELLNANVGTG